MFNLRFLLREMVEARRQAGIFILCVALSITSLVALNSFRRDVHQSIIGDARALHGGDLILHSHRDFSPGLLAAVAKLRQTASARVRTWEMYSVVRKSADGSTLFCNIKAVERGYPLYGEVALASGERLAERLRPGTVAVSPELLERLGMRLGDPLQVGGATLRIADVVLRESTRPVDLFNFGPRVFVAAEDLASIDLVRTGSRVEYEMLLKIENDAALAAAVAQLGAAALEGQERVSTFRTARSGLKRFFDNLLFFLSLISIFTLLLAGIGMQSSLAALLRQKEKSLAIVKALGATQGFLFRHYLLMVLLFGFSGSCLGIAAGMALKSFFPVLFTGIIPPESVGGLGPRDIAEGLMLGLLVVSFFTFLPLYRLREVKPNAIFRGESSETTRGVAYYLAAAAGFVFLTLLVISQLEEVKTGIYFMAGATGLILVMTLLAGLLLAALRRLKVRPLPLRQALRSLLRPGNSTQSVIVTLASALAVLLAIYLVEKNLHATYAESYPQEAPNLFLLDIQPNQREGFTRLVGGNVQLHPIIRARLKAINDVRVSQGQARGRFSDTLTREFNLTYRDELLADEVVIAGENLFRRDKSGRVPLQVSILDTVAEMGDMQLGDILDFNIQGVPLRVEVTSIRSRTRSLLYPYFYFVFPSEYLKKAPQTLFAALHVEKSTIPRLENAVVAAYPNISIINMAETAAELGAVMQKLAGIVNFFALFSILAGLLIIISSILATRLARIREAVYYKVLGGGSGFVLSVFFQENMVLGLSSSLLAVLLAQTGSWALCHFLFDISYNPCWQATMALVLVTLLLVVSVGLAGSLPIMRQKPIVFLREQTNE